MSDDVYTEAIKAVAEFYEIDRDVCIVHFWDEVESYMRLMLMMRNANINNVRRIEDDSDDS